MSVFSSIKRWFKKGSPQEPETGWMQLSFTLPVKAGAAAQEKASSYVKKLGLKETRMVAMNEVGQAWTYFVVDARAQASQSPALNQNKIHPAIQAKKINQLLEEKTTKRINLLGATLGKDPAATAVDGLIGLQGFENDPGLESYSVFKTSNLFQTEISSLVEQLQRHRPDVLIVAPASLEVKRAKDMLKLLAQSLKKSEFQPKLKLALGPQLSQSQAKQLGFDGGFAIPTHPSVVSKFIADVVANSQ